MSVDAPTKPITFVCERYPSLEVLITRKGAHEADDKARFIGGMFTTIDSREIEVLSKTQHVAIDSGIRYQCPKCQGKFWSATRFANHVQTDHANA